MEPALLRFEEAFFALPLLEEYDAEELLPDDEFFNDDEPFAEEFFADDVLFDEEVAFADDVFFAEDEALFAELLVLLPEYAVLDEELLLC